MIEDKDKTFEFTCPECGEHNLVKNTHPVIAHEHFKGINEETGELEENYLSFGFETHGGKQRIKYGFDTEVFFDCYDCEYRPQRILTDDDDELFEDREPGQLVDITTDEEMVKWMRDQLSTVETSVSIVEPEKEIGR